MSIADEIRAAAYLLETDYPHLRLVARLRTHADTIEKLASEMDDQYGWLPSAQAAKWADVLKGETK